jgi:hypothetical protein
MDFVMQANPPTMEGLIVSGLFIAGVGFLVISLLGRVIKTSVRDAVMPPTAEQERDEWGYVVDNPKRFSETKVPIEALQHHLRQITVTI